MTAAPEEVPPAARREEVLIFSLNGREISVGEVLRATQFRGGLEPHWRTLLAKISCEAEADTRELEADGDELQARSEQFRYGHDLISAEETDAWFERRRIDSDDFSDYVSRGYWHESLGDEVTPPDDDFLQADAEQRARLIAELHFTGALHRMARDLAWRLAAAQAVAKSGAVPTDLIAEESARFHERLAVLGRDVPAWLAAVGGDDAWLEQMVAVEAAYREQSAKILTPAQLIRSLRAQRLGLTRFETGAMEFDSAEAAREAVLCVREDGMTLEEIAQESGFPHGRISFLLEDMPKPWQMTLYSTPVGGLAGPFDEEGLIRLYQVDVKVEPEIADDAIRVRLEERLLATSFADLLTECGYRDLLHSAMG